MRFMMVILILSIAGVQAEPQAPKATVKIVQKKPGPKVVPAKVPPAPPSVPVLRIGDPVPGTDVDRFEAGRDVFRRVFTKATGLGPLFNNSSCAACHERPVTGGQGAFGEDDVDVERHATAGDQPSCDELASAGGPVFRQQSTGATIPPIPAEARVHIGGRSTPALFSSGTIDAASMGTITENARRSGGRAALLPDGSVGRFGRKATDSNLADFVRGAFATEMGVEVPSELSEADLDLATFFVRNLAPPVPQVLDQRGQQLFAEVGCAGCHTPIVEAAALYSDLALHDLGPGLADICKGQATIAEFRTEPLMGIRFRTRFLHDGRATTLVSAIAAHGGAAQKATDAFFRLERPDRAALLKFVSGL